MLKGSRGFSYPETLKKNHKTKVMLQSLGRNEINFKLHCKMYGYRNISRPKPKKIE